MTVHGCSVLFIEVLSLASWVPMRDGECARDWMELLDVLEPAVKQIFSQKMANARQVLQPRRLLPQCLTRPR